MVRKKGYAKGMREALESALLADPDDRANYMAYSDWLSELHPTEEYMSPQYLYEGEFA